MTDWAEAAKEWEEDMRRRGYDLDNLSWPCPNCKKEQPAIRQWCHDCGLGESTKFMVTNIDVWDPHRKEEE